mmetsp:Transcript_4367/g.9870  ORF Transcript_4367/g.9870 Transcript_4367/m.9870 type:complete len:173 (-) Transcript_4367:107-625(-)
MFSDNQKTKMGSRLILAILSLTYSVAATKPDRALRGTTPCALRKWHLDFEHATKPGCSNSWKVPSWTAHRPDQFYYASSENCCSELFEDGECNIVDECEPKVVQVDDHCDNPTWHFDMDTKEGCTNNSRFPVSWNDPHVVADYLFRTHEECCEKFVKRGFSCKMHDVCTLHH